MLTWKNVVFSFLLPAIFFFFSNAGAQDQVDTQSPKIPTISLMQAVRTAIVKQPAVLQQQQAIIASEASLLSARGEFDPNLNTQLYHQNYENYLWDGREGKNQTQNISSVILGLTKKTRTGISLGPQVEIDRIHYINASEVGMVVPDAKFNQAIVKFTINIPLLKGGGRDAASANEMAAMANLEASRLSLQHTVSQVVREAGLAYWEYLAAKHRLDTLSEIEKSAQETLTATQLLVKGDEKSASELNTIEASLAEKISSRISAEQDLFVAMQNLGLAMGLEIEDIDRLPLPGDEFPTPETTTFDVARIDVKQLFQMAADKRADLQALGKTSDAATFLLTAAKKNEMPQLDINADVGYQGWQNGDSFGNMMDSLANEVPGPSYSGSIKFSYPLGNNAAKADILKYRSQLSGTKIQRMDLQRNINSGIIVAVRALQNSIKEIKESDKSIKNYQISLENQQLSFKMGMANMLDVVNMRDYLENARLSKIDTLVAYAQALVNLGYQTGVLIIEQGDEFQIDLAQSSNFFFKPASAGSKN